MSDRVSGLIVVALALAFFASATQLQEPFFADPLGPKTFPMLVSGTAILAGLMMVIKPDAEPKWPALATLGRLLIATIVLILYAYALKPLGFIVTTALAATAISYQIKPNAKQAVLAGCGISATLFVVFKFALGLSLFAFPRWLMG